MTDRELLELAAKAAGIEFVPATTAEGMACELEFGLWLKTEAEPSEFQRRRWNPLADDGDALRLAVWLNLTVRVGSVTTPSFGGVDVGLLRKKQDANAATRRAIVLAAAMIGKAMP